MATRQLSIESSSTVNGSSSNWLNLLPSRKFFTHLREDGPGGPASVSGNIMCTVHENLFVWKHEKSAVLTMNLKRICAAPEDDVYQVNLFSRAFWIAVMFAPSLRPSCWQCRIL